MKKLFSTLGIAVAFYLPSFAQWSGTTDIYNTNSGNVGIGTAGPAAKLDIWPAGSGSVLRGNSGGSIIVPAFELNGYNTNVSNAGLTISTNDGGTFSEKMRVSSNGDVGIGTTSPAVKLDVHGSTAAANFQNNAASNSPVVSISQTNAGGNDAAQGLYIDARSTGSALDIYNNTNPLVRVKTNGNVGIGTGNPTAQLDIKGTTNGATLLKAGDGSYSSAFFYAIDTKPSGVNTPRKVLQLGAGGTHNFSYGQQWYASLGKNGGAAGGSNDRYTNQLIFSTSTEADGYSATSDILTLVGNGNVGIGTTNPDEKLAVNGIIHSKEVKVDMNGWSDYVFEPTYDLPSLESVKTYIDKNHRLPEMPSTQEVLKNGINLGEIVNLQMKKIEELTLYLIEKDKQVAELRNQLNKINEKLNLK